MFISIKTTKILDKTTFKWWI